MDPNTLVPLANLGVGTLALVVVSYIHWHTIKVEIPRRDNEARAEREAMLAAFHAELAKEREATAAVAAGLARVENKMDAMARQGEWRPLPPTFRGGEGR